MLAAGRAGVAGDSVSFSSTDLGNGIGPVADNGNGTYTATITSSTSLGAPTITATDATSGGITGQATLTQFSPSTTMVTTFPDPAVTNQPVTLIASVTAVINGTSPSGSVAFYASKTPIAGCGQAALAGSGQTTVATCQASFTATSSPEQITAVVNPAHGSNVAGSTSPVERLVVGKDSTSTSLTTSTSSVEVGAKVTYSASVAPSWPGPPWPSGTVQFRDRGRPIASCANVRLAAAGQVSTATCKVAYPQTGTHAISVAYDGDRDFIGSASSPAQPVTVFLRVLGAITPTMGWGFAYAPTYTRVTALGVQGMPVGGTVGITCTGRGCPFAKRTLPVTRPRTKCRASKKHRCPVPSTRSLNLQSYFGSHHVRPGSQITVALTRPSWIGKMYIFTMRLGRGPRIQIGCLAPGGTQLGVGC